MAGLSSESMAKMMTSELLDGCLDDPTVKAGFIGEIGCSYPLNGNFVKLRHLFKHPLHTC